MCKHKWRILEEFVRDSTRFVKWICQDCRTTAEREIKPRMCHPTPLVLFGGEK